jgi:chromosome segregation ATPase
MAGSASLMVNTEQLVTYGGELIGLKSNLDACLDSLNKTMGDIAEAWKDEDGQAFKVKFENFIKDAKLIDAENAEREAYCNLSQQRKERMLDRRQNLLRMIGSNADEMVNRARLTYPEVSRNAHLRQDYNALRLLQERAAQEAESKIAALTERLKKSETEAVRLRQQCADVSTLAKALAETREKLHLREKELVAERQKFETERQRFAMTEQSLMSRLSALESSLPGGTNQSREARSVKLAPWFQVKS